MSFSGLACLGTVGAVDVSADKHNSLLDNDFLETTPLLDNDRDGGAITTDGGAGGSAGRRGAITTDDGVEEVKSLSNITKIPPQIYEHQIVDVRKLFLSFCFSLVIPPVPAPCFRTMILRPCTLL